MIYYLLGFLAVYLAVITGLAVHYFGTLDRRRPFGEDQKLLREAGHSLRAKISTLDRQLPRNLFSYLLSGMPPLMMLAGFRSIQPADEPRWLFWLPFGLILLMIAVALTLIVAYVRQRRNLVLGLFGERLVAEHLEPLKASGHFVFHDVPAGDPAVGRRLRPGNIDHVVVGPAGVFAIETKTRRQGRTRVGVMAHEIIYDGRALAYPWGEDQHGLEQAQGQAEWLAAFLERELGRPIPVHPLLVFPGWTILRKDHGPVPVKVLSPHELPAAIERLPASGHTGFVVPALDAAAIDRVARQLEARCRDVEF